MHRFGANELTSWLQSQAEIGSLELATLSTRASEFQAEKGGTPGPPLCLDPVQVARELGLWGLDWVHDDVGPPGPRAGSKELSDGVKGAIEAVIMEEHGAGKHGFRAVRLAIDGPSAARGLERFSAWFARELGVEDDTSLCPSGLTAGGERRLSELVRGFRKEFVDRCRPEFLLSNWSVDYLVIHERAQHNYLDELE